MNVCVIRVYYSVNKEILNGIQRQRKMDSSTLMICLVAGFVTWYFYNKFRESEGAYVELYSKMCAMETRNEQMKLRMDDLQTYKNDVSHTLKILDKELMTIHSNMVSQPQPNVSSRVSILTPDILTSLFQHSPGQPVDVSQQVSQQETHQEPQLADGQEETQKTQEMPINTGGLGGFVEGGDYDRFLIN